MREVVVSDEFLDQFDSLPDELRQQTLDAIKLLNENRDHPSLRVKKLHALKENIWECRVTRGYRILWEPTSDATMLWKVGAHELVDRAHTLTFSPHTQFRRLDTEKAPVPTEEAPFEVPAEWLKPVDDRPANNPFSLIPISHLRILGVPSHLVKAVRTVPYIDDLERIPGLPEHTLNWLLELTTDADLEKLAFDSGRLIFRTTLDLLEGYCEGRIKRLMLNLSSEQQEYVSFRPDGITLLRGCAGSGKTTIGIYRAIRFAETGAKVIFLTYNKTLASVARRLIEELIGPLPDNLHVLHLDSWIARFLRSRKVDLNVVDDEQRIEYLKSAITTVQQTIQSYVFGMPWTFFRDEIVQVIKGNGLQKREEYLSINRYGRQKPLNLAAREAVWAVYTEYQNKLSEQHQLDWQDVAPLAYEELLKQGLADPFVHVVVDEVQDLTPIQLRVVQRLNKGGRSKESRSLFLVGDIAQTIYARGFSWEQAGIRIRGNSFSIQRNFRNTRQIAEAAATLGAYNQTVKLSEYFVDPQFTKRQGPWPIVLECDITDREIKAVSEKILSLVSDQRFRVSDFAIICPTNDLCGQYQLGLRRAVIPCVIHTEDEFDVLEEQVKILTIHSAKGLEFPVVFLTGLHIGMLPVRVRGADPDEALLQEERDRKLMYVGMTRAAEALYLVTSRQRPSPFISEIETKVRRQFGSGGKL